jgi:steroid delta-isomerase-like uncharacterized protein
MAEGRTKTASKGKSGTSAKSEAEAASKATSEEEKGRSQNASKGKSGSAKASGAAKATRPRRSAKSRAVEEHARSYFEALAKRDPEGMVSHWSQEGVDDIVPMTVLRGRDQIHGYFRELFAAVPDAEATVQRIVADDRHAAVEWRIGGTFSGGLFQGLEPTGRRVDLRGLDLMEIEDGQILRNTAYFDGAAFARQVGMLPQQDSGAERAMKGAFNTVTKLRKAVNERMGS